MTPLLLRLTRVHRAPWRMIGLALAVLASVAGLSYLARPADQSAEIARVQEVGYRATRRAAFRRRLAAIAQDSLHAAARRADSIHAAETARLRRVAATALVASNPRIDSTPRVIVGPAQVSDTLIALPYARAAVQLVVDSANAALANVRGAALIERGRASLAIQRLEETIVAQDTVIAAKTAELALVRKSRPRWYRRAFAGTAHALAGTACGATGWALGGPVVGLGAGAVCAAVAGIIR